MDETDLVQALRQRDPEAFQRACDRYLPSIWRYVYTRVGADPHLAEDIVSETMLALVKAVTAAGSELEINNPGGWLRTVANNKVQDHFRAVARVRHLIDDAKKNAATASTDNDPSKLREIEERRSEVRQAMEQLSDQYRTALEWKYLDKLSVREIAERWGTTEKAVESILYRARCELRRGLDQKDAQKASQQPRIAT